MYPIELFIFSIDIPLIQKAIASGINGIIIDWELKGKQERQTGADTLISHHTVEDLQRVRQATSAKIICRLNAYDAETEKEALHAIDLGADELLLPMVKSPKEVEELLRIVDHRCQVGILLETRAALQCVRDLAQLPLSRVFVGLNDLMIEDKRHHIFTPLIDGSLETLRSYFHCPFGFGGLTLPEKGFPIPCHLLLKEMLRLRCRFTFLRRSFLKDIQQKDMAVEVPRMHQWIRQETLRSEDVMEEDRKKLELLIHEL